MSELSLTDGFDEATRKEWLSLVEKVLKGADFDKCLVWQSSDNLPIAPLYTRADAIAGLDTARPGVAPYMRGTSNAPSGYGWDIRQLHSGAHPAALNKAILQDLAGGVTSIALQFQAPGQTGLPLAPEAVVKALKDIDLEICPIALLPGENFGASAAYLLGAWAGQNIANGNRMGAFNADPLGILATTGGLSQPLPQSLQSACALIAKTQDLPHVTAMLSDGRPYHNAGASEAQELAALLSTLVAYLRSAETAGIAPDQALPKIAFALAADTDQFLTIAKLRAARELIWRVAQPAGAGDNAKKCHITVSTSWRMMAKRDPWVNMLRTTIACAAAAMGGADAITVLPFTAALGQPDDFARRIARNTQIVLQEESSLGGVIDPAGGSWYVEKLTDDLARKAWDLFQQIEAQQHGNELGMAAALQSGFVQDMIAETASLRNRELATGRLQLTGVSAYPKLGDDDVKVVLHDVPPTVVNDGIAVPPLATTRLAQPFEALRDAADDVGARTGAPPKVFLVNLGEPADFGARSTWAKNFFAAGGIEALASDGLTNSAAAGAAFAASGAKIACLCSSDEIYGELADAVASLLKAAGASRLYLAGRPADSDALKNAGIDEFIVSRCDAVTALKGAQAAIANAGS